MQTRKIIKWAPENVGKTHKCTSLSFLSHSSSISSSPHTVLISIMPQHKIYQLRTTICVFFSIANSNIKWKIRQYKRVPDLIITLLLLVYAYSFTCFVGFTDHNWIDMIMWESNREGWRTRGYSCPRATLSRPTIPTFTTFLEVCWNERDGGFI